MAHDSVDTPNLDELDGLLSAVSAFVDGEASWSELQSLSLGNVEEQHYFYQLTRQVMRGELHGHDQTISLTWHQIQMNRLWDCVAAKKALSPFNVA